MIEFVFMLTHQDATVPQAAEVLASVRDAGLRYIGFKDVGAAPDRQRELADAAHEAGALVAGATVAAARSVLSGEHEHAVNVAGGLLAYGPDAYALARRAAAQADKILKGAKPGELPVEQPDKFDFVVNLKTAQILGLTIPQSVLQQATEVLQ